MYLDDIIIFSVMKSEHFRYLRTVLQVLKDHGLKIKLKKSVFILPEIVLLSHIEDDTGVCTDPAKIE